MARRLGLDGHRRGRESRPPARLEARQFARVAQLERRQRVPRRPRSIGGRARQRRSGSGSGASAAAAEEGAARLSETLEPALPDHLDGQAERLMHRVCDAGLTVSTAESCTGGMLAALLTDIEGAGHGFDRGFIAYSRHAKAELLGIGPDVLDNNDAVSEVVARAMAEGTLNRSAATIALGVTGFAGPGAAGQEEGLVHFALARRGQATRHREAHFGPAGRGPVRVSSIATM